VCNCGYVVKYSSVLFLLYFWHAQKVAELKNGVCATDFALNYGRCNENL
jgi:hypothetical protein